jgi:ATP-binding cassette subfamily B protein/ATP-binding cassette subfamily C protein/ATP-binding cassette subfamily B multidrug efflux pump
MKPEIKQESTPMENMRNDEKWQAMRLLTNAARQDHSHVWLGIVLLAAAAGLEAIGPLLGKAFIDNYLLPKRVDLWMIAALLVGNFLTGCAATWLRYLQLMRLAGVAMRSVQRLREQVYLHVLRLPMQFFDKAITGQLVSRVTNDTEAVKNLYVQVLFVMLDSSIVVLGALTAMAWLDWRLMLIVATLIPAMVVIVWFYQRWSGPAVARARQLRSELNAQLAESIAGMSVLQASLAAGRFSGRFAGTNQSHYQARIAELRANAWLLRPALDLMNSVLLVIVIWSFSQRTFSGVQVGILYAFVSYIARVVDPLIQITMQFGQIQQAVVSAARVNTLLHEQTGAYPNSAQKIRSGEVAFHDVSFGYDPAHPVLHNINLRIESGNFYGIVGHTGSGKSTLLSLLLRFYTAQSGRIELDRHSLATVSEEEFRLKVGLVPQDPFLLAASVRDNIAMGREMSQERIEAAARSAHAHEFIQQLAQGYDTELGEGGAKLSTGQKQLVAIARALAGDPVLLLLDEATSHIDSETEQVVQTALSELRGKVTIIAIAHRLSTIRDADQIIVLNHGKLIEQGRHADLMELPHGVYQKLYLLQALED